MSSQVHDNNFSKHVSHDEETIIAHCTPTGSGAIALLRISGTNAVTITNRMAKLASKQPLTKQPTHTIHFGWVTDTTGTHIDQVMFLLMRAPKTFTGQNTVEITTHNNQFIIQSIIERALACGARLAQEGEFSRRAFLNGKIDLPQAEAINELIHANSQMALKASLAQLEGSLSHSIATIEKNLLQAVTYAEASFEFVEQEIDEFSDEIKNLVQKSIAAIERLKKNFNQQQQIRQGVRIALIGSVNAGKSSLFNKLLSQERAIVTSIPGTTRDVIETSLYKNGTYQTFVDTAGLRKTDLTIEREGIYRSKQEAHKADIILLVYDNSRALTNEGKKTYGTIANNYAQKIIPVYNKTDLCQHKKNLPNTITVSCTTGSGIEQLQANLAKKIDSLFDQIESPFLLNQRQYATTLAVQKKLEAILPMLAQQPAYELISVHLQEALSLLSAFSGKTISERTLDNVFKTFCIGK